MENLKKRAKALSRSKEILKYEDVALEADGSFEFGFMVGSIEQKTIDIDKACEWLNSFTNWKMNDNDCNDESIEDQFRKFMEEEL